MNEKIKRRQNDISKSPTINRFSSPLQCRYLSHLSLPLAWNKQQLNELTKLRACVRASERASVRVYMRVIIECVCDLRFDFWWMTARMQCDFRFMRNGTKIRTFELPYSAYLESIKIPLPAKKTRTSFLSEICCSFVWDSRAACWSCELVKRSISLYELLVSRCRNSLAKRARRRKNF